MQNRHLLAVVAVLLWGIGFGAGTVSCAYGSDFRNAQNPSMVSTAAGSRQHVPAFKLNLLNARQAFHELFLGLDSSSKAASSANKQTPVSRAVVSAPRIHQKMEKTKGRAVAVSSGKTKKKNANRAKTHTASAYRTNNHDSININKKPNVRVAARPKSNHPASECEKGRGFCLLAAEQPNLGQLVRRIVYDDQAQTLRPEVLRVAITAYQRSTEMGIKPNKPIITLIDYTLASSEKRLWVIDLRQGKILYNSLVAHGKNSGHSCYARCFSNRNGSLMSCLGVFMTGDTYFGKDGYSLRLQGLERGINDNARKRCIVMHGSPYVSERIAAETGKVGCSWGCPAVEAHLAKPIINTIKGGSLIISFYPDRNWLRNSSFVRG